MANLPVGSRGGYYPNEEPTATIIMVEPVYRTCETLRNCGYVLRAVFPTEVLGAGIYSSVVFGGSMVLANAVNGK